MSHARIPDQDDLDKEPDGEHVHPIGGEDQKTKPVLQCRGCETP